MAKPDSWRQRPTRKRGFDDDMPPDPRWAPPPSSYPAPRSTVSAGGPEVEAVVKWFNAEKGFGFVEVSDGSGDAFLHVSVLSGAGASSVNPGAKLKVRLGQGAKGPQVMEVSDIREGEAPAAAPRRAPPRAPGMGGGDSYGGSVGGSGQEVRGTVKWYNAQKGFGFVAPDGGGKDVFVHATALERGGIPGLSEGQSVRMQVVQGKKGPEAASVVAE
jgi:CspA family cold shock protein